MNDKNNVLRPLLNTIEVRSNLDSHISSQLLMQLSDCSRNGRIKVFYSPVSVAIGYISWNTVNKESLRQLINFKQIPLYTYEWNEGHFKVIHDIAVLPLWRKHCWPLFRRFFKKQRFIIFLRRDRLNIWYRHHGKYKRILFN